MLICRTQNRSGHVAQALAQRGWTNVRYVVGGMSMWALQGLPMVAPGSGSDRGNVHGAPTGSPPGSTR